MPSNDAPWILLQEKLLLEANNALERKVSMPIFFMQVKDWCGLDGYNFVESKSSAVVLDNFPNRMELHLYIDWIKLRS